MNPVELAKFVADMNTDDLYDFASALVEHHATTALILQADLELLQDRHDAKIGKCSCIKVDVIV